MERDDYINDFHRRIIILSRKMTIKMAYEAAERREKVKNGHRLYKNYDSYRNSISQRRKQGKINL